MANQALEKIFDPEQREAQQPAEQTVKAQTKTNLTLADAATVSAADNLADNHAAGELSGDFQQLIQRYVKILLWPTIITGIFEISAIYNANESLLLVLANIALIGLVVAHARREKLNWQYATVIGAIAGGSATLMLALYKLIAFFHIIYFFNLVTQPVFTAILDAVATGFIFIIVQSVSKKLHLNFKSNLKGGEPNGEQ